MAKKKTQRELIQMHEDKAKYFMARSDHFRAMAEVSKSKAEQMKAQARDTVAALGNE